MTRFIHLTDLHISHPDAEDPKDTSGAVETLKRVVELINNMAVQPAFVVASGDLTNTGHARSYDLLQDLIAPLNTPLIMALGNHDRRSAFHAKFGRGPSDAPHCHDTVLGGIHIITLDTSVAGHVAGAICDAQFDFLTQALAHHADLPKLIVMHHPPRVDPDGLPWGSIDMASTDRLADTLRGHHVVGILSGHIHINNVSHWHGIPIIVSNGQDSTVDLFETTDLRLLEGTGLAICTLRSSGLSVNFAPLSPAPRELGVIDRARLLSFS